MTERHSSARTGRCCICYSAVSARAPSCASLRLPQVVSTMATASIAEVAATGHPCLIFQLYVIK